MEITMAIAMVNSSPEPLRRVQDVDRHVGARMRERRIMLGLTQQQMAELIGVTYQQAHKYEKGINRVAAGRLYNIAQALGVEVGYFFEGLYSDKAFRATPQQRMLLELAGNFMTSSREHQQAICSLARALSEPQRSGQPSVES
jgi:transcriptional regulator with XRE-family HTH domain